MSDIAEKAGVSRPTVSAVLNRRGDVGRISAETQQQIWDVAKALGYRRNEMARTIGAGKSRMLGFLGGFPDYEHVGYMLGGAIEEAEKAGYSMKVFGWLTGDTGRASIERCAELRLGGVIALRLHPELNGFLHQEMERYHIPVVFLDMGRSAHAELDSYLGVYSDDKGGIQAALRHLMELGHREIGFIDGDVPADQRMAQFGRKGLFEASMAKLGLAVPPAFSQYAGSFWNDEDAERTAGTMLAPGARPTAIICANDAIALTVVRTALQMGLRVPEDLSVVGFGNFIMARYATPPLTTIAQPFQMMGRTAVQHLLEVAQGEDTSPCAMRSEFVPTELVIRKTTARRPQPAGISVPTQLIIRNTTAFANASRE